MSVGPEGKAAAPNTDAAANAAADAETKGDSTPAPEPAPAAKPATKPAAKASTKKAAADPLLSIDSEKLPVATAQGEIRAAIESYAGRSVLSITLEGWIGDAPLKILAEHAGDIEAALKDLRKQLSK